MPTPGTMNHDAQEKEKSAEILMKNVPVRQKNVCSNQTHSIQQTTLPE